jgi:RsiW-degrading membrane proteinase PrsW (M82 family)
MILPAFAALVLAVALSAAAFFVLWLDRFKGEPVMRLVLMAAWGVACALALRVAAPALASLGGPGNGAGGNPLLAAAVPVLEELLLAAGLAILATSHFLDGPLDGAAYGTVTGLGYAAFQIVAALATGASVAGGAPVIGVLEQAGATALVGGAFGSAKLALRVALRVPAVLTAALVAGLYQWGMAQAAAWGWQRWGSHATLFDLALGAASALVLVGVFGAGLAVDRRVLVRQLTEEVTLGVLPEWVVVVIPSYRKRIRADWWLRRDERREVVRLLTSLAYRKQQLRVLSELRANLYGLEVGRLRQRARKLIALATHTAGEAQKEM